MGQNKKKKKKKEALRDTAPTLWQIVVRFWPLIRKQRTLIISSGLALLAEVFLRLLEPWPLKFVFDWVFPFGGQANAVAASGTAPLNPPPADPMTILAVAAVAVVFVAILRAVAGYLRRVGFALAGNKVLTECRGDLFTHLTRLSLSYHSQARTGDLITRITGDIGRLKEVAITAAMPLLAHVITLVGMMTVMFFMDWRLSLIGIAILPLFVLSTRRIGGKIRQVARVQRQRKGEMGATAAEAIGSIKTVQSLSLEDVHEKTFTARNKSDLREGVKAKRLSARLVGTADILVAIGSALVLWFGARMVVRGEMSSGDLIVFLAYMKSALRPIGNLAKYSGRIAKAAASAERIIEVLDTTPAIQDRSDAIAMPERLETLTFENVTFGYEKDQVAVDDFSLEAVPGDVIVLAGPSGAGKSSVVNLLLRLYDPRSGSVKVNGQDLRDYKIESVRRNIAVVPQENVLFAVSIRDNIAFGSPGAEEEQIIEAAKLAQAHDFIMEMPLGYDTQLGERGESLSEGQRQRIAIARCAIRDAPLLVFDEPTASLDNENNRRIRQAIRDLSGDRICFMIAHDLSTVLPEYRVLFLDRGRIVEQGTHGELLAGGGRYAAMYGLQRTDDVGPDLGRAHALGT